MELEFDTDKRSKTLSERGLDFARAKEPFDGVHFTGQDTRVVRMKKTDSSPSAGLIRLVVLVWTPRGAFRRIISMRKANDREKALFARSLE